MAVADARRGNKRQRLSPPEEGRTESEPGHTKRKSKSAKSTAVEKTQTFKGFEESTVQQAQSVGMISVTGLDSSEPAIRRSTMKSVLDALQARSVAAPFTVTECLQLWRGFFVAIYMHDSRNAVSVQNLLREIAGTFSVMAGKDDEVEKGDAESAGGDGQWLAKYHTAFWETVTREWAGIDSHRINKYLLLVRFVLRELSKICMKDVFELEDIELKSKTKPKTKKMSKVTKEAEQNALSQRSVQRTRDCLEILGSVGPLNPSQRKISDGLRLHVLDILSDELFGALSDLEASHDLGEDSAKGGEVRATKIVPLVVLFRESIERTCKSDSGAQKHIRSQAKDSVKAIDEQLVERSWEIPE